MCATHNHGYVPFVVITIAIYHWVCNKSITTGDTSGAGTDYSYGRPELISSFSWFRVCSVQYFVDHCLSCWPLYCLSFFDFRFLITTSNFSSCPFLQWKEFLIAIGKMYIGVIMSHFYLLLQAILIFTFWLLKEDTSYGYN